MEVKIIERTTLKVAYAIILLITIFINHFKICYTFTILINHFNSRKIMLYFY
jgi:hypothetical protein